MDYKWCLENEEVPGRKFKLWEELKDFLLDRLDEDPYLSSLQLKRKELEIFNKNISKSTIIRLITKEGFWYARSKIPPFNDENTKLVRIIGVIIIKIGVGQS